MGAALARAAVMLALDLAIGKVNDGYLEPLSYITAGPARFN